MLNQVQHDRLGLVDMNYHEIQIPNTTNKPFNQLLRSI